MYAARDGYVDIVKQLLAAGADTGIEDKDGMTALLHAEERDREKVGKCFSGKLPKLPKLPKLSLEMINFQSEPSWGDCQVVKLLEEAGAS